MKKVKLLIAKHIMRGNDHWGKLSVGEQLQIMALFQTTSNKRRVNKAYGEKRIILIKQKLKRLFFFFFIEE